MSLDAETSKVNYRPLGRPIDQADSGQRLDKFLAVHFRFLNRHQWQQRIRQADLIVNQKPVRTSYRLKRQDQLFLNSPPEREPPVDDRLARLWEGDGLMAVYKPAPLPMHENGPYRESHFAGFMTERFGRGWSAVHRLDLETSGIVLCAEDLEMRQQASHLFAKGAVRKEYLAICRGVPSEETFLVDAPIGDLPESKIRIKKWVAPDGQEAKTQFDVLASGRGMSLMRARPFTGRTNQIRIHAAWKGFPLVGDKLYHPDENVFLEYFERGTTEAVVAQTGHLRLCLHASRLSFVHPRNGRPIDVRCDLPSDLQELAERLK